MNIIKGDLIKLALAGEFDVIVHGVNCFCVQKAGIAKQMAETFLTSDSSLFKEEHFSRAGNINKLGNIEIASYLRTIPGTNKDGGVMINYASAIALYPNEKSVHIVNAYTQYYHLRNLPEGETRPFSYTAFALVLKKLNHIFKDKHIGMPWIGCGLGGADKQHVAMLIKKNLTDCKVTVVEYEKD